MSVTAVESLSILRLLEARGVGDAAIRSVLRILSKNGGHVADLAEMPADEIVRRFGLRAGLESEIARADEAARGTVEQIEEAGIEILMHGFQGYPEKLSAALGETAPPVLFVWGAVDLLDSAAVAICGSRDASETGIEVAAEWSGGLADEGVVVVSGYARGVDLAAHRAALERGGATVLVLAEGILQFRVKTALADVWESGRQVVVSEFHPRAEWRAASAMRRNRTICALSDAVIIIESGMNGGTFAAGETAIELNRPLFVAEYSTSAPSAQGNSYFLKKGAVALRADGNGQPSLNRVLEAIRRDAEGNTPTAAAGENHDSERAAPVPSESADSSSPKAETTAVDSARQPAYPKRLIEVDLPIKRISAHARREKSIRHGHISTLHIWWARRPLAACRAVICAALWPDPVDPLCPQAFREVAIGQIKAFAGRVFPRKITEEGRLLSSEKHLSHESRGRWEAVTAGTLTLDPGEPGDMPILRYCLLDFIADFANWDNSTVPAYLETARALTQAAHEGLGGAPGTRPLVVDPFAGGGSIPLEALRVGADAFASDLNPVAVLLNKVVLEYIPKYGQRLADEVRKWGRWVKEQAEKELAEFYPKDPDGATPIAYLWARTILSEAPAQSDVPVEVPMLRSMWLGKKRGRHRALRWARRSDGTVECKEINVAYSDGMKRTVRRPVLEVFQPSREGDVEAGTVTRGAATCPVTGYTTPVENVRRQLKSRSGGTADARICCVVLKSPTASGRIYRIPNTVDEAAVVAANEELVRRMREDSSRHSLIPDEKFTGLEPRRIPLPLYGISGFRELFMPRQQLALSTLYSVASRACHEKSLAVEDDALRVAVHTCLALTIDKVADLSNSCCRWEPVAQCPRQLFARQAMPMVWDPAEGVPISESSGSFGVMVDRFVHVATDIGCDWASGEPTQASALSLPLPSDAADAFVTDPPYYYSVPYSDLSDFFYVWLRRFLAGSHPTLFNGTLTPKEEECVQNLPHSDVADRQKSRWFYENSMLQALTEGRRIAKPNAIGTVVFAHTETEAWESLLTALVNAGWCVTASWPIDTEMATRVIAQRQSALGSSVHLVCRPRENMDGSLRKEVGEWRDILSELPQRIHEWMPRLASEGVVGADAIFACLGPALEIFSRYSRVEKASGEAVPLREYLEHVWAAVSTEALSMIFHDADAAGLEPDARLTAMWLWTVGGAAANGKKPAADDAEGAEESRGDDELDAAPRSSAASAVKSGFALEFDAARKIAQGLGIHLEKSESIVEVKGDKARLLPVSERTRFLFGKDGESAVVSRGRKKKAGKQRSLFEELDAIEADVDHADAGPGAAGLNASPGATVLDRVHQAMILFAAGRGEALRRFLVDDGAGTDGRFWKLAQSLSALYPKETDEKRWVDGVLARKKGLGL